MNTVFINGSYGEGGGQILRTSLALSCLTGKPVQLRNIRKARPKPGLQPQHLTAVKAAATISRAEVEGAEIASTEITFRPGPVTGRDYLLDVSAIKGSAGSTSLVLQTILLPLLFAREPSAITLVGGTHVPWSPTFHYVQNSFLPMLSRMGLGFGLKIEKWGWYPAGGGRVEAWIDPRNEIIPIRTNKRGKLISVRGISAVANLPQQIGERQRSRAINALSSKGISAGIELVTAPSPGKGTLLFLLAEFENIAVAFDSLGALGKRAETVADEACSALFSYLEADGAMEPHLADQLIPYLALAKDASEFTTTRITKHLLTNIWVVKQFMDVEFRVDGLEGKAGKVTVEQ